MKTVPAEGILRPPKVLIYGPPGKGKTVWSAQFAPRPALHLDLDAGGTAYLSTLKDAKGHRLIDPAGLTLAVDITVRDMEALAKRFRTQGPGKYRSVVIDTLTMLQQTHRTGLMGDKLVATQANWGENGEWARRIVAAFVDCPIALVIVCHDRSDIIDTGLLIKPALSPMLATAIEPLMDCILYLTTRVIDGASARLLICGDREGIRVKDRTGRLPAMLKDAGGRAVYDMLYDKPWGAPKAPEVEKEEVPAIEPPTESPDSAPEA